MMKILAIKVIIKILCQKKYLNNQLTAKNCINEYVDSLKKDINIYNFPINQN